MILATPSVPLSFQLRHSFNGLKMDIDLLRTFVAICETGSFTAAARQVGRTQSAVSVQMRRLEDSLGRPLLVRGTAGVAVTEHGRLLLDHARQILAKVDEVAAIFDRGALEGVVVLGLPDDYAPRILSSVLKSFAEVYPDATLHLVIERSRALLKRLADGEVDLAFVSEGEGVVNGPVALRDRMVWVGPERGDVHLRNPLPLAISDEAGAYARRMLPALDALGRPYKKTVLTRGMTGLRGAVVAGIAVTALMSSGVIGGMRVLGEEDGLPPLDELAVRLERAPAKKSAIIDRLEAHILSGLTSEE
jgi:DNA-binding transcriptional LysR family regulator